MADIQVTIKDTTYPLYNTMGAMVRFRQLTGKETTDINEQDPVEVLQYVYCQLAASASAEDMDFPYTFEKFADLLSVEQMQRISAELIEQQKTAAKKKRGTT